MAKLDTLKGEALVKEMERRARDTFMVYNPTSKDYPVVWEGMTEWVVPAKDKDRGFGLGKLPVPRFIAEKYAREMVVDQINQEAADFTKRYKETHNNILPSDWRQIEENNAPRTNDPGLIKKYMKPLIIGLVKEYGYDIGTVIPEAKAPSGKTIVEDVFDELVNATTPLEVETVPQDTNARTKKFTSQIAE